MVNYLFKSRTKIPSANAQVFAWGPPRETKRIDGYLPWQETFSCPFELGGGLVMELLRISHEFIGFIENRLLTFAQTLHAWEISTRCHMGCTAITWIIIASFIDHGHVRRITRCWPINRSIDIWRLMLVWIARRARIAWRKTAIWCVRWRRGEKRHIKKLRMTANGILISWMCKIFYTGAEKWFDMFIIQTGCILQSRVMGWCSVTLMLNRRLAKF